jgi:hypothetical protein
MAAISVKDFREEVTRNTDENLKVLRTIYAVLFVVGFREAMVGLNLSDGLTKGLTLPWAVSSVALVLVAVRMFWGVSNIRRYVVEALAQYFSDKEGNTSVDRDTAFHEVVGRWKTLRIMAVDVPILLSHSFLFYLLCKLQPLVLADPSNQSRVGEFVGTFSVLLLLNGFWLVWLATKWSTHAPEFVWLLNNLSFAFLPCTVYFLAPASWFAADWIGASAVFWIAVALYLANSAVDLLLTSWAYMVGPPG